MTISINSWGEYDPRDFRQVWNASGAAAAMLDPNAERGIKTAFLELIQNMHNRELDDEGFAAAWGLYRSVPTAVYFAALREPDLDKRRWVVFMQFFDVYERLISPMFRVVVEGRHGEKVSGIPARVAESQAAMEVML